MTDTYRTAFTGYEDYFIELNNLERQPNERLMPVAAERIEKLLEWFREVDSSEADMPVVPINWKFGMAGIVAGAYFIMEAAFTRNLIAAPIGGFLFGAGARGLLTYFDQKKDSSNSGTDELCPNPSQYRYMYAKFMLQSIEARIDNES